MSDIPVLVSVQEADFDCGLLQQSLHRAGEEIGAVATFTGYVRAGSDKGQLEWMELEHYPEMTEHSLRQIAAEASERWQLKAVSVVHRVGRLSPGDRIVWVGAASAHRGEAFEACEFMMDYLKTRAPFWKREAVAGGDSHWVEARASDNEREDRWRN